MCQPGLGHRFSGMRGCTCGCGGPPIRRFFSSKEEEEWMEDYRDQLKKELAGVEKRLKERKEK